MSERDKFMARFADKQAAGLVDVKFLVDNGSSMSDEDFFAAANAVDEACSDPDKHRVVEKWDRDPPLAAAAILAP